MSEAEIKAKLEDIIFQAEWPESELWELSPSSMPKDQEGNN